MLNNFELGLPTGAYSIWMFITGGYLMWRLGKKGDWASENISLNRIFAEIAM